MSCEGKITVLSGRIPYSATNCNCPKILLSTLAMITKYLKGMQKLGMEDIVYEDTNSCRHRLDGQSSTAPN